MSRPVFFSLPAPAQCAGVLSVGFFAKRHQTLGLRFHPDPLETAHLPYLRTDQLVVDNKRQRKENKYEPATPLIDTIGAALCISPAQRPSSASP